jgi:hypothetical protein
VLTPIGLVARIGGELRERRIRIVRRDDDVLSDAGERELVRFTDGEAFHFTVNGYSTATRGVSELFSLADAIDGYEQLMYAILRHHHIANNFSFDVTLEGMNQSQIDEWLKGRTPPKPLSVRAHNEKEKWAVVGPELGAAANHAEAARLQRNHILGGQGVPEHFYGGGGDVNRAAAAEMGSPFEKSMTSRQKVFGEVIQDVLVAQIEAGIRAGVLQDGDEVRDVTVQMPDVSTRDLSRVGTAIAQFSAAMVQASDEGWVDPDTCSRVLGSLFAQAGVQVDPEDMLRKAREERGKRLADEVTSDLAGRASAAAA